MSHSVGCNATYGPLKGAYLNRLADPPGGRWQVYYKENGLMGGSAMSPADLWVLLDETPDSLDDTAFAVVMPTAGTTEWANYPSKLHGNSCAFSFADGHSEIHHWLAPGSILDTTYSTWIGIVITVVPNDPDIRWLGQHTSMAGP